MGKQHLDLLSELHRDFVLLGFGNVVSDLACVFVFFAGYLAGISVWTTLGFGWADLTDLLQRMIAGGAFTGRPPVRV